MKRPYELPHDMERHTGQEFKAKDLTMGADLERRLMIPCPVIRVILQHLTSRGFRGPGSGQVSHETKNMLDHWIQHNRPCLLPFLKLDPVPQHHVKTPPDFETFRRWRSEGVWNDQSVMCDSIAAENDDTTESVVVPDDDVDPCGGGGSSEL